MKQSFDQILYDAAVSCLNIHYKWGGNNPLEGFDCSGLCCYLLKVGDAIPFNSDMSAQMLFNHFYSKGMPNVWGFGALSFYGKDPKKITHVGFCLDDRRMVEAAHGSKSVKTMLDAEKKGAFVRVSPINRRDDLRAVIMPVYPGRSI